MPLGQHNYKDCCHLVSHQVVTLEQLLGIQDEICARITERVV